MPAADSNDALVAGPGRSLKAAAVRSPGAPGHALPSELIAEVFSHAREVYPEECCGLLLGPPDRAPTRIVRCANVQAARKARGDSELDPQHAFWIDERELFTALRDADARGDVLSVVYHSHIDADAYLSHADVAGALDAAGAPLYPGAVQLVVSVREGQVHDAACFVWDSQLRQFVGRALARTR